MTISQGLFKYQSGRVIALGRVMLCILFLLAALVDRSEPGRTILGAYSLLIAYTVLSIGITVVTWRDWWLDARLAVPMHAIDMAVFTAIVFSANSSTSPFFLFFVLPLLSAAIRWGWRETALTATSLIILHLTAGLVLSGTHAFAVERFVIRSGHLLILSLLLIWFGIHQRIGRLFFRVEDFDSAIREGGNGLSQALSFAIEVAGAQGGALVLAPAGEDPTDGLLISGAEKRPFGLATPIVRKGEHSAFLYNLARGRTVTRLTEGRFHFAAASELLDVEQAHRLGMTEGLVAEVRTGTQSGWLLLWGVRELSTDFIDLARELARAAGAIVDRHALLEAIEAGVAARTRLSLARDVHDSIVQFLAGAAFRVEAIKRGANAGAKVGSDLDELKRLLVEEQGEVRGFLLALRRDRELDMAEAVAELRALAERLGQQWSIDCIFTADGKGSIPIRLQLDLQQMLREAVANAVRHGGAKRVDVGLAIDKTKLHLSVADNGSGFARRKGKPPVEPWSLKERVERARGSIRLESQPGSTNILIDIPLAGAAA